MPYQLSLHCRWQLPPSPCDSAHSSLSSTPISPLPMPVPVPSSWLLGISLALPLAPVPLPAPSTVPKGPPSLQAGPIFPCCCRSQYALPPSLQLGQKPRPLLPGQYFSITAAITGTSTTVHSTNTSVSNAGASTSSQYWPALSSALAGCEQANTIIAYCRCQHIHHQQCQNICHCHWCQ